MPPLDEVWRGQYVIPLPLCWPGLPPCVGSKRLGREEMTRLDEGTVSKEVPTGLCGSSAICFSQPSFALTSSSLFWLLPTKPCALTPAEEPSTPHNKVQTMKRRIRKLFTKLVITVDNRLQRYEIKLKEESLRMKVLRF